MKCVNAILTDVSLSERLNAMLKKLFDAQITGDVHEELVKASANGSIGRDVLQIY